MGIFDKFKSAIDTAAAAINKSIESSQNAKDPLQDEIVNNKTVVVLDPPRKGCDKSLLQTLNKTCADKIIYVSCDPSTLARDLNILCGFEGGKYKINFIRPYDMFPQTKHVETVVVLSLKN